MVQPSYPYMATKKNTALMIQTFVSKVMSQLFKMLSSFVIAFLPRSKCLLIPWLKSPSALILETKENLPLFPHLFAMKKWDWMPWSSFFECWVLSQFFHSPLLPSSRGSLVPLHFLPLEWYRLHVWGSWYFSQQFWFQLVFILPGLSHYVLCI